MNAIDQCVDSLIRTLKAGPVYKQYCEALDKLKTEPELKKQVDEIRRLNYHLHAETESKNDTNMYQAMEDANQKMEELCRIPEVNQFFEAELYLCRQIQEINAAIHQGIQFDIPEL